MSKVEPWHTLSYSMGHVLAAPADGILALYACPDRVCSVLARLVWEQAVPMTGQFTDSDGRVWYRVEFRQKILWAEAAGYCSFLQTGRQVSATAPHLLPAVPSRSAPKAKPLLQAVCRHRVLKTPTTGS